MLHCMVTCDAGASSHRTQKVRYRARFSGALVEGTSNRRRKEGLRLC